jgi:hypothetical protein
VEQSQSDPGVVLLIVVK